MTSSPPQIDPNTPGLDHGSSAYILIITVVICLALATVATVARIYTRRVIVNQIWLDDYFAVISCVLLAALGINLCIQTRDGIGSHAWDVSFPEGFAKFEKDMWISLLLYNIAVLFIKLMFLLQYYRIVPQIRIWKIIYTIIMILVTVWTVSQIFVTAFACVPIDALWDISIPATCNSLGPAAQQNLNAGGNIVTDVIILVLPLPAVWRRKLPKSQNLVLVGIFSLGVFTCIIPSFKLIFRRNLVDQTYDAVGITSWAVAEVASGEICGALLTLRPLLGRYFPDFDTQAQPSKGYRIYESASKSKAPRFMKRSSRAIDRRNDLEMELERPYPVSFQDLEAGAKTKSPRVAVPPAAYRISAS